MEENKDLNMETEETVEETAEETVEAVDKASFADVNYEEEKEESAKKEKVAKGGLWGILIAILAVIAIAVMLVAKFAGGTTDEGLANRYNNSIGAASGKYLYHSNLSGSKLYKTEINTESLNQEELGEISASFFAEHKGDVYYYESMEGGIYRINDEGEDTLIYPGKSYYHQYVGNYIYFTTPETNYGGFVRRIPLTGGEAEIVLNVPSPCYAISEGNIIYYDPAINSLLITTIKNGVECAAAAEGQAVTSSEIKAVVLAERYASNINVIGKDVYFVDASANNTICHIDMKTGVLTEMNHSMQGMLLNAYKDYLFYIGADNSLCRMNLDGKDIRNFTGNAFKEIAGFGIYEDKIVYYALLPQLNSETMQTEYEPVIGVMTIDGEPLLVMPADTDDILSEMYENMEVPEATEESEEITEEVPEETEG